MGPRTTGIARTSGRVAKKVLILFSRETMCIFYWIGLWSIVMPSSETNTTLAWMYAGVGMVGMIALDACVQLCVVSNEDSLPAAQSQNSVS